MRMPIFTPYNKSQIFWAVIISNSIDMMDNLIRFKVSPKYIFHYEAVFQHLISRVFIWMVRAVNKNIAVCSCKPTTFPIPMIYPRSLKHVPFSFIPRRFPNTEFVSFLESLKSFWHSFIIPRLSIQSQGWFY